MGYITLAELAAGSVPTPSAGKNNLYFDTADGVLKFKDDTGAVTTQAGTDGVYKTIAEFHGRLANDQTAQTLLFQAGNTNAMIASAATSLAQPLYIPHTYLRANDYAVTGLTTKLRVVGSVATNTVSPGTITFTFGLYPLTIAGGNDVLTFTAGTVTAGSNGGVVSYSGAGTSTVTPTTGMLDFTIPADGAYTIAVVTNATLANNAACSVDAKLQLRHT